MFTGIVEKVAKVISIESSGTNKIFRIENPFDEALYIDQSISHNGVCLTIIEWTNEYYKVVAIHETLEVTNLSTLKEGSFVNLERGLKATARLDGHLVQGHVDGQGRIIEISENDGSWIIEFEIPKTDIYNVIYKGSITLEGISLTVSHISDNRVQVSIIPYTYENTTIKAWRKNKLINLEYDIIGKYISSYMSKIKVR